MSCLTTPTDSTTGLLGRPVGKGHSFDFAKVTAMCQQHKGFEALSLNLMQMDQVGMVTLPSV